MTDPAADAARAAAAHFAAEIGPGLPAEVEIRLASRSYANRRPAQYDTGLVVSIAALIVTVAQLAQSIWAAHREHNPEPSPEAIARETRIELREFEVSLSEGTLRITEFIAVEITRQNASAGYQD